MSLEVEDGTGKPNADSYVSVAEADAYHAAYGNAAWASAASDLREVALRRATQYIDLHYEFVSSKLTDAQALEWPRVGYDWPVRGLPQATSELALRALDGALVVDVTSADVKRETVGPITVEYFGSVGLAGQVGYTAADRLLAPYTSDGGWNNIRLEVA